MARPIPNPFRFGALARDESFTDRDVEIAELLSDARNGQDVVIFAPRRFGKTSLVDRVAQRLVGDRVLVGQINLMRTPTKERLAEKLAATVYDDIAGPLTAREGLRRADLPRAADHAHDDPRPRDRRAELRLRRRPSRPRTSTRRSSACSSSSRRSPPSASAAALLILDEFQEVIELDPQLPKLLRSVLQEQPEVGHFYLGSKRHMMERIFNDENEPFWRSAKQLELGPIAPAPFGDFIERRFADTGRRIDRDRRRRRSSTITGGHPYATQELCYFLWEETPTRRAATAERLDAALERVLRSEHTHFSLLWDRAAANQKLVLQALAREPGHPFAEDYRRRHALRAVSSTQKAVEALARDELIGRDRGRAWIAEPFLAEWIRANVQ